MPDRGPNAVSFDSPVDDTVSYVPRFHTIKMNLQPSSGPLPFTLTTTLEATTLLFSHSTLVYGSGSGLGVGPGAPVINTPSRSYFRIYISDEYGPYINEFDRASGQRIRVFKLPEHLFVSTLSPQGAVEIAVNTSGRVANKGMEGLAITPDGNTLVGIMQNALLQDAAQGGNATSLLRMVTVDVSTGKMTHEYAYLLTTGSGASEITALNEHEFLVDERDGKGLGDGSKAKVKQIFKIDLAGAVDVQDMDGTAAAANAVGKTLFLDVVKVLTANGFTAEQIPAKLEGLALGPDVDNNGTPTHTLWLANDNDFLQDLNGPGTNPNQFFVFGFTEADLSGSVYVPQQEQGSAKKE